jgi:hypothetical protein
MGHKAKQPAQSKLSHEGFSKRAVDVKRTPFVDLLQELKNLESA